MSKTGKTYRYSDSLKHEYGFKKVFTGIKEVKTELKKFIDSYNHCCPVRQTSKSRN